MKHNNTQKKEVTKMKGMKLTKSAKSHIRQIIELKHLYSNHSFKLYIFTMLTLQLVIGDKTLIHEFGPTDVIFLLPISDVSATILKCTFYVCNSIYNVFIIEENASLFKMAMLCFVSIILVVTIFTIYENHKKENSEKVENIIEKIVDEMVDSKLNQITDEMINNRVEQILMSRYNSIFNASAKNANKDTTEDKFTQSKSKQCIDKVNIIENSEKYVNKDRVELMVREINESCNSRKARNSSISVSSEIIDYTNYDSRFDCIIETI